MPMTARPVVLRVKQTSSTAETSGLSDGDGVQIRGAGNCEFAGPRHVFDQCQLHYARGKRALHFCNKRDGDARRAALAAASTIEIGASVTATDLGVAADWLAAANAIKPSARRFAPCSTVRTLASVGIGDAENGEASSRAMVSAQECDLVGTMSAVTTREVVVQKSCRCVISKC